MLVGRVRWQQRTSRHFGRLQHLIFGLEDCGMAEQEIEEPTINHVAVTVPRDMLDADGRRRIAEFFDACFGMKEDAQWSKDRQLMVLRSGPPDRPQHDAKGLYMAI